MAGKQKKSIRKIKDKIIHAANDIREIKEKGLTDDVPNQVIEFLDSARDLLIQSTNQLTAAANFTPKY